MACNKCNQEENSCTCIDHACSPIDASCVIYNLNDQPSDLNCIEPIDSGTSLKVILEKWDQYFCNISNIAIINCVKEKLNIPVETTSLSSADLLTRIQEWICNRQDINVKVTPADSTSGYLYNKITTGDCLFSSVIIDDLTNEQKLKISIDWPCVIAKIPTCFEIQTNNCIIIDNSDLPCNPQPSLPTITKVGTFLSGTNCNGSLQWYNLNDVLIGSGNSIEVPANNTYYARCMTACGYSEKSLPVNLPPVFNFTKTRKAIFTKECGVNECSVQCLGSSIEYTKTYTSTISQDDANSKAENDAVFAIEGQTKVNLEGSCTCLDCNCVFPVYNSNIVVTNATCNGSVIQANGQILIVGIANADKFGFYIGQGGYNGVSYSGAISLGINQNNIESTASSVKLKSLTTETRVIFRFFNGGPNCFTDVVVNHTPADCTQEQLSIIDTTVSCEIDEPVCNNYSVVSGGSGANLWYENCTTGVYTSEVLAASITVQRCSKTVPQVTGGVATLNGSCL